MRREIIVAIFVGLIIGLAVAFGAWRFNSQAEEVKKTPEIIPQEIVTKEEIKPTITEAISLNSIKDLDVITVSPYKISGITKPNSTIVISSEDRDYLLKTADDGVFEKEVNLKTGINHLLISNYTNEGELNERSIKLIYSKDFASLMETTTEEKDSTESGNTVLDKVKEKVESLRKNPKAILGTVADKTEDTLQIKNLNSKIELLSVGTDTEFSKTGNNNSGVKFSDVGIGDFVIALGFSNGNGVLDAKRILLTDPLTDTKRKIHFGKISDLTRKNITISDNNSFALPRTWDGPNVSDLENEMQVAIVATDKDLRTIQILEDE